MAKLYIVASPIGNLDDISKRAIETLENVDLILAEDTRHSQKLLNHFEIKKNLISYHKFNENKRSEEIIEDIIEKDLDVAVISDAGTPCISDPGAIIVKLARQKGIDVYPIPGPSALLSALSVSGFIYNDFTFLGFFPRGNKERDEIKNLIVDSEINTFVFYESAKRIIKSIEFLNENIENLDVFVINDISKYYEKSYFDKAENIIEALKNNEKASLGEYTVVIQKETVSIAEDMPSLESVLIDEMVKNKLSAKDAIKSLSASRKYKKNDLYQASLNLKEII